MQTSCPSLSPSTAETLFSAYVLAKRTAWTVLKASGQGLRDYLQGQITQDMRLLSRDQAIHACLLTPQGKAETELFILEQNDEELVLLTPSAFAEAAVARLRRFALGYTLRIGIVSDLALYSIQGANAIGGLRVFDLHEPSGGWLACSRNAEGHIAMNISENPRGFWVVAAALEADRMIAASGHQVGEDQIEAMRIIQGLPRFGVEWDQSIHPLNANLIELKGVSFDKGCYVGQEVTSRMHWRGGIRKRLYRCRIGKPLDAPLPCPLLNASGQAVGEVKSVALDHEGQLHGIAWLPIEIAEAGSELMLANGAEVRIGEACHAG